MDVDVCGVETVRYQIVSDLLLMQERSDRSGTVLLHAGHLPVQALDAMSEGLLNRILHTQGQIDLGPFLVHLSHVVTEMTPHTRRRHLPLPLEVGCFDGRQELPLRGQRFAVGETDLDTTPQFGARTCVDPRPRRRTRDGHRLNAGRAWLSEWG